MVDWREFDPERDDPYRWKNKEFPYTPKCAPAYIICDDCSGNGWGPMVTDQIWREIGNWNNVYLCQPCMENRLKRPLIAKDLRDCPMNYLHPLYKKGECTNDILD